jgi:hypothetical protein
MSTLLFSVKVDLLSNRKNLFIKTLEGGLTIRNIWSFYNIFFFFNFCGTLPSDPRNISIKLLGITKEGGYY